MSESKAKMAQQISELRELLQEANTRRYQVQDKNVHLSQVLLVPTDEMLDAVRPIMMIVGEVPRNLGVWRDHVRRSGRSIEHWPKWAREGSPDEHITKAGMAEIIWMVMAAASGRQESASTEFAECLAKAEEALKVVGTGKLKDGVLVREGARSYFRKD